MLNLICLVFALVCFILAGVGFGREPNNRYNLISIGLAFWVASFLVNR